MKAKTERIELRASKKDRDAWARAAEAAEMSLSDWIRRTLNASVKP